ncbi:FecCD family ABC transporter permease [Trichloromonas sp.]|uniref:FecCD family ABC transporter permease n=1 Tax=Trichloromonas sp. TaxID=3069249 RepID=UPI002A4330B7|nr:iron ABC transporter permease [Trichloromonas sp.]
MKRTRVFLACAAALLLALVSIFFGPRLLNPLALDAESRQILLLLRLPRSAVAFLMGGALGASGLILQGVFRNPLADPYILGLSGGASLAAALGILLAGSLPLPLPLLAFAGALGACALVAALGRGPEGLRPDRLLLGGIGLGFFFSAVLLLLMTLVSDGGLKRTILWMSGDLSSANWELIPGGLALILGGLALALARSKGLNVLGLGDEIAHGLGFNPGRERFFLFIAASLMTAAAVSLGGTVGFVGLLVPHAVRHLVGADAQRALPVSFFGGGTLLCLADSLGRSLAAPLEIPAGVIVALIGAPWFILVLRKKGYGL